jgi:hypothetical protein
MTMGRYRALYRFWEEVPPADLSMALWIGWKPPARRSKANGGRKFDERGLPIIEKESPPTLDEKPGTMADLAKMLKGTGKKGIWF